MPKQSHGEAWQVHGGGFYQIVKYLEQVLRGVNNRTFLIKNAIEWSKFTSGVL